MSESMCGYRWMASRVDTIHQTVPVLHVCDLELGHERYVTWTHHCPCGATVSNSGA